MGWNHVFFVIATAITIWTGTRAAIAAMAFVAFATAVSLREIPSRRAIGRTAMLTGLALILAFVCLPDDPTFRLFEYGDFTSVETVSGGRTLLWKLTFLRWLDSPIFGWGTGSVFWEVYAGWPHTQPHNVFLQCLISWGIVGTAGAIFLLGRAIHRVHAPGIADDRLRPLLGVLYGLLFQSLLEGMLHYPRFIQTIFVLMAVIYVEAPRMVPRPATR